VRTARDGPEALALLRNGDKVDLLFADLVMPKGLSGAELARQARQTRPDLPVLLTTGFALGQSAEALEFPVLGKPYNLAALSEAVGRLVMEPPPGQIASGLSPGG
jgi:CheY-like chemotaxis protein